jgi:hypothetical protein
MAPEQSKMPFTSTFSLPKTTTIKFYSLLCFRHRLASRHINRSSAVKLSTQDITFNQGSKSFLISANQRNQTEHMSNAPLDVRSLLPRAKTLFQFYRSRTKPSNDNPRHVREAYKLNANIFFIENSLYL